MVKAYGGYGGLEGKLEKCAETVLVDSREN